MMIIDGGWEKNALPREGNPRYSWAEACGGADPHDVPGLVQAMVRALPPPPY